MWGGEGRGLGDPIPLFLPWETEEPSLCRQSVQ